MVNFVPDFISDAVWHWGAEKNAEEARLKAFHRNSKAEVEAGLKAWEAAHPRRRSPSPPSPTISSMSPRSPATIMSGSAATWTASPTRRRASTGVQDYPLLFAELIRRGWSDANLAKLAGGNVLRVMRRPRRSPRR